MSLIALLKWAVPAALVAVGLLVLSNAWVALLSYHAWIILALSVKIFPKFSAYWRPGPLVNARVIGSMLLLFPAVALLALRIFDNAGMFSELSLDIADLGLTRRTIVPFATYLCVFNGILEELYWRTRGGTRQLWTGDLFYALFHVPVVLLYMPLTLALVSLASLLLAGLVWRASLSVYRGKVWPAVLSHVACNVSIWFWLWSRQAG